MVGALGFGYLTDRIGRKKLFMVTLGVYLVFTVATAFSWSYLSFSIFRVLAGVRNRRRVLGDQRADPGPGPWARRHRDQRLLVGRGGGVRPCQRTPS